MKKRVAVIQFPGNNSEYETRRALWDAGMDAEFFRWNDNPEKLKEFDGFVFVGGFAYEDRGRAGLIASMDPVMEHIKDEAAKGKPVLGICNGAQVLVESGLIPGGEKNELLMCLARNKKVKDGKVIGTGFYNENVNIVSTAPKGRSAFNIDYRPGELGFLPVAHGEGRYTTIIDGLMDFLEENEQIVFKYCTEKGEIDPNFPVNPNGALHSAAAICNPKGNVMAIMPHPERAFSAPMPGIFTSMRKYMEGVALTGQAQPLNFDEPHPSPLSYKHQKNTLEFYVKLIITDNEAQTIENALRLRGFDVRIQKWLHYEIEHSEAENQDELAQKLAATGELLNSNKETLTLVTDTKNEFHKNPGAAYFLVRDIEDTRGESKSASLGHRIRFGWFWEVQGDVNFDKLLATNIFHSPHAQILYRA
ncbi:phosphoribosylformylglycinamidine synthase I [Patescibacteria group bacterium]|nr:phosphoribosylformylglycinamidine synthase I [Patescibacteria group bacterium]